MSDKPSGEKTEQPTPKRLRDARNKGQVAKSTDVVTTISTFFVLGAVAIVIPQQVYKISEFINSCFDVIAQPLPDSAADFLVVAVHFALGAIIPIAAAAILGVVLGNILQFGFLLSFESLKPDLNKLNPMNGVKRIFSLKTLVELLKSSIKILIFGALLYNVIGNALGPLCTIPFASLPNAESVVLPMLLQFVLFFLLGYVVIAIADYIIQRRLTTNELMMTKDEVKRENHEMEGDPMVKSSRKRIMREMIFEDTATATRKSTVVVTNPTHYAAAIYYERGKTHLPILRAKGAGFVALRMMAVAREERVPIVENVPLARALYNELNVSDIIPNELLEPVTEILRWVRTLPPRVGSSNS